jgi:hypothetical protein
MKQQRLRNMKKGKSRPISRVLSRTAIHLGCRLPCSSSNLPRNRAGHTSVPLFDLAPGGVCPAAPVTRNAVRSYRTFSPLPGTSQTIHYPNKQQIQKHPETECYKGLMPGGIFSVALSIGSRLPGVTWHPAQWSPDFPPFYLYDKTATAQPTLPSTLYHIQPALTTYPLVLGLRSINKTTENARLDSCFGSNPYREDAFFSKRHERQFQT